MAIQQLSVDGGVYQRGIYKGRYSSKDIIMPIEAKVALRSDIFGDYRKPVKRSKKRGKRRTKQKTRKASQRELCESNDAKDRLGQMVSYAAEALEKQVSFIRCLVLTR